MLKDWKFDVYRLYCFTTQVAVSVQEHDFTQNSNTVFLHPGLQEYRCLYCGCECIVWCWCVHTYLTLRLVAVMIHSIMANCVPQRVIEKLIICLLISVPCSRQFSAIEQTQDVAIIDTPSLLHILYKASRGHLFNHHIQKRFWVWYSPQKCNLSTALFLMIRWAGYNLKMCRKLR